jgi:hypothetical protein
MRFHLFKQPDTRSGPGCSLATVRGWTLLEMAGVLAVLGLLMGFSVPTIQDLSFRVQRDAESREVSRLIEGFRSEVLRRGTIPDGPGAIQCMAAGVGLPESMVRFQRPGQQRLLLRDPAMRLVRIPESTGAAVGWSQVGNVRFLLLSSVGDSLRPEDVTPGMFQDLWDLFPDRVPEGWRWTGRSEDLVLGRIDLQREFVEVGWSDTDASGASIILGEGPPIPVDANTFRCWILKGTTVALADQRGVIGVREVIDAPAMYRHEQGHWHRAGLWTPEPARPSAQDFARMADGFLRSPTGPAVEGVSQREVWAAFVRFSSALGERFRGGVQKGPDGELVLAYGDFERVLRGLVGSP